MDVNVLFVDGNRHLARIPEEQISIDGFADLMEELGKFYDCGETINYRREFNGNDLSGSHAELIEQLAVQKCLNAEV